MKGSALRGRLPGGDWLPARGRSPSGGERPFLFLRKKKRSFTPKKKKGPLYGAFLLGKRRLAALRTVVRTTPGRYGHPMVEQGKEMVLSNCRLAVPLSRQSAAWRAGGVALMQVSLSAAREAPHHHGPERGTRRRRVVRAQTVSVSKRQAVTAGRDSQCHTKAVSRRFLPETYRRPGPFFLWSQGPFLFPQKKKWTLPRGGSRTPGGTPPPGGSRPRQGAGGPQKSKKPVRNPSRGL